jgi:hypothetical protein
VSLKDRKTGETDTESWISCQRVRELGSGSEEEGLHVLVQVKQSQLVTLPRARKERKTHGSCVQLKAARDFHLMEKLGAFDAF